MTLIVWLVAIYAAICAAAYFGNRLLMYFPDPTRVAPEAAGLDAVKEIEIAVAEGVTLIAWHAPAKDDKSTILYFHGNAANAANRAARIELIKENGFGVLYLNNRGYGGSGGRPTEEDNVADAIAAYDYLIGLGVPAGKIVAYGELLRLRSGGAAGGSKARRRGRAGGPAHLDRRCGAEDLFLAAAWFADHRQIQQRAQHPLRHARFSSCMASRMMLFRWKWVCGSTAPPMSRSASNCFPRAPMTICSTMAPGRRRAPMWIRWAVAPNKKRKVTDGPRRLV